jgi:hypothetical protein
MDAVIMQDGKAGDVGEQARGWFPDPSGRFELRWWDGRGWTDWVTIDGVVLADLLRFGTRVVADPPTGRATTSAATCPTRNASPANAVRRTWRSLRTRRRRPGHGR